MQVVFKEKIVNAIFRGGKGDMQNCVGGESKEGKKAFLYVCCFCCSHGPRLVDRVLNSEKCRVSN